MSRRRVYRGLRVGSVPSRSLADWVRSYLSHNGISVCEVAEKSGIGVATLYRIVNGEHTPRYTTFRRLVMDGLDLSDTEMEEVLGLYSRYDGGVAYFLQLGMSGPIRVGVTSQPITDLVSSLEQDSPDALHLIGVVPGGVHEETMFRRRFAFSHLRGPWFRNDPEVMSYILNRCGGVEESET